MKPSSLNFKNYDLLPDQSLVGDSLTPLSHTIYRPSRRHKKFKRGGGQYIIEYHHVVLYS